MSPRIEIRSGSIPPTPDAPEVGALLSTIHFGPPFMTPEEQLELENAIELAVASHQGQRDKQDMPYILHPLRVMLAMLPQPHLMVPAVLHDVVEDCGVTIDELPDHDISGVSIEIVDVLTRRDGVDYFDYIRRLNRNLSAKAIKIADLMDNMDRINGIADVTERGRLADRYSKALTILC